MTDWPDLVVAATVGAASRPLDLAATPAAVAEAAPRSTDPAGSLLDAAVAFTVATRAGRRLPHGVIPEPAPTDPRPVVSDLAADLLRTVLVDRELDLAGHALADVAAAGKRLPDRLAPVVLALGARHVRLRAPVLAACGPVAPWLARRNPVWAWAAAGGPAPGAAFDPTGFDTGDAAERLAQLRTLRATDPAAASTLLSGAWPTTSPDERADLLTVLGPVPLPADEPLLEATLDDRRAAVRQVAADLLARLDGSAFRQRAAARVAGLLRVERRGLRRTVTVVPPPEFDDAALRDGLPRSTPAATRAAAVAAGAGATVGPAALRVQALVAAAPLAAWESGTGLRADQLVGLVEERFAGDVLAGWVAATRRERSTSWAIALLDHLDRGRQSVPAPVGALLDLLPPAERDRRIAAGLGARRDGSGLAALRAAATPWSATVTTAVGQRLRDAARHPPGRELIGPLELCGRGLPATTASAEALRRLAEAAPDGAVWMRAARAAADIVDLRRRLTDELR